jgi:protein-disulfide isomerase
MRPARWIAAGWIATGLLALPLGLAAQTVLGATAQNLATPVKDSSMLKPPAGAKVAIVEWTDLECPYCAHAFPFVHLAASEHHIPLVEYDFLIPGHVWSPQAAVFARYLKDKISPDTATDFRRQVFAQQYRIAGPDDLNRVIATFMQGLGKPVPSPVDPTGEFRQEVDADAALGNQMGLLHTPTIFVVTAKDYIEVADVADIDEAIAQAEADVAKDVPAPVHHAAAARK